MAKDLTNTKNNLTRLISDLATIEQIFTEFKTNLEIIEANKEAMTDQEIFNEVNQLTLTAGQKMDTIDDTAASFFSN